jgi:aspartate carbamoyltransferase regulatory subunit
MEKTLLIEQPQYIKKVMQLWNNKPYWVAQDIAEHLKTKVTKVRKVLQIHAGEQALKKRASARANMKHLVKVEELTPIVMELLTNSQFLPIEVLAKQLSVRPTTVRQIMEANLSPIKIAYRESMVRSKAKKNHFSLSPELMEEIRKLAHYIQDRKGYLLMLKPVWATGRVGSKHIFVHQVVMMEHLKITKIPEGFVVHHVNGDKTDNRIHNLALLTNEAHLKQHQVTQTSNELTLWELKEFMMWKSKQTTVI